MIISLFDVFRQQRFEGLSKTFIMLKLHTFKNSYTYLLQQIQYFRAQCLM